MAVSSSNTAVVKASLETGSNAVMLKLEVVGKGQAVVTITASASNGDEAKQAFSVYVGIPPRSRASSLILGRGPIRLQGYQYRMLTYLPRCDLLLNWREGEPAHTTENAKTHRTICQG